MLSVSLLPGMRCYSQEELRIRSRQAPISMRIRPRQASAKLTFLSWLGPTGGTANRQRLLLTHFHKCMMPLVLNSKLVNSDHSVASLLIRVGWSEASEFALAFANPEEKNAIETCARYGDPLSHICGQFAP